MNDKIIDTNVFLSRWPMRRLPLDETDRLVDKLQTAGVTQAWAGSFDALLHKDLAAVNARLADDCKQHGRDLLLPFGAVNPVAPDWKEDLRRCREVHKMPGIRLHPNYHSYTLDHPAVAELLAICDRLGMIVQLAIKMEDERTQHPLVQVKPVDVAPLPKLLTSLPDLKLVITNGLRTLRGDTLGRLASAGKVYFEIAMQEGVGGVAQLMQAVPVNRILFGSYSPFFYFESALLKLRESELGALQRTAIFKTNAQQVLKIH